MSRIYEDTHQHQQSLRWSSQPSSDSFQAALPSDKRLFRVLKGHFVSGPHGFIRANLIFMIWCFKDTYCNKPQETCLCLSNSRHNTSFLTSAFKLTVLTKRITITKMAAWIMNSFKNKQQNWWDTDRQWHFLTLPVLVRQHIPHMQLQRLDLETRWGCVFWAPEQFVSPISLQFLQSITVISSLLIRDWCVSCSQLVVSWRILVTHVSFAQRYVRHWSRRITQDLQAWLPVTTTTAGLSYWAYSGVQISLFMVIYEQRLINEFPFTPVIHRSEILSGSEVVIWTEATQANHTTINRHEK